MSDAPTLIDHYLQVAQPYLDKYGYAAVFALVLVESFGVPAPGESIIIAGAFFAARGKMSILLLLFVAWTAAVIGDNIGFAIGHYGGRRLLEHRGRVVGIRKSHLHKVERFFHRYGGGIVILARFVEVLRQLNGVVAGSMGMEWWRFLTYNAIGAALWVGAWGTGVYFLGQHIEGVIDFFHVAEPYLIGAGVMALLIAIGYIIQRIRGNGRPSNG